MIIIGQVHTDGDEREGWVERERKGKIMIEREEEEGVAVGRR